MRHCKFDDVLRTKKCMEIGLTIKDWSRDKSQRDMKSTLPSFEESRNFNEYLEFVEQQRREGEDNVIPMA